MDRAALVVQGVLVNAVDKLCELLPPVLFLPCQAVGACRNTGRTSVQCPVSSLDFEFKRLVSGMADEAKAADPGTVPCSRVVSLETGAAGCCSSVVCVVPGPGGGCVCVSCSGCAASSAGVAPCHSGGIRGVKHWTCLPMHAVCLLAWWMTCEGPNHLLFSDFLWGLAGHEHLLPAGKKWDTNRFVSGLLQVAKCFVFSWQSCRFYI